VSDRSLFRDDIICIRHGFLEEKKKRLSTGFCTWLVADISRLCKRGDLVPPERLVSLGSLRLKEKPVKGREPRKNGDRYVRFVFLGITKPLKLSGFDYLCANTEALLNEFNAGDTMKVSVDKNDFGGRADFFGENIYGLTVGQRSYCDLNCRNKTFSENQKIGAILTGTLSFGCLIASMLSRKPAVRWSKNKKYEIESISIILVLVVIFGYLASQMI
jgi:hypothetical protein